MQLQPITPVNISGINMGALLGTSGTRDLVQSINDTLGGSSFFGSHLDNWQDVRHKFYDGVLVPLQKTAAAVKNIVTTLMNPDMIRPLITEEDFATVPPCMYEAIVMYQPVRKLLEQGRINGFGFDPDFLPSEDVWGRLISNGVVDDIQAAADKDRRVEFITEFDADDPRVSFEEIDAVEETRMAIDRILADTRFDPTDYPEERG